MEWSFNWVMTKQLNRFEELKRKLYLIILPVIVTSLLISQSNGNEGKHLDMFILPFLTILFSLSWLFVYRRRWFNFIEQINVVLISVIHLLKTYEIVYIKMVHQESVMTGSATYWTPLVFIFISVTLIGKKGVIYCLILWVLTISIGFSQWSNIPLLGHDALIQYYISNLIYIIFLFFAGHIISSYTISETFEKMAYHDTLTGIANRRRVYQLLEKSLSKNVPFTVIFFDIDYFKKINDVYGHVVGDKVLIDIALITKEMLKDTDHFGRWGGEEFIILSFMKDKIQAEELAENIRKRIETFQFVEVDKVTSSFGVSTSHKHDTTESLIKRVDQALYLAKENGRNQVRSSFL